MRKCSKAHISLSSSCFQVIALSKQQGLLHSPRSEDGGSTVSCTGSIRYRALTDQDPSPPASTTGAMGGGGTLKPITANIHVIEEHHQVEERLYI